MVISLAPSIMLPSIANLLPLVNRPYLCYSSVIYKSNSLNCSTKIIKSATKLFTYLATNLNDLVQGSALLTFGLKYRYSGDVKV